MSDEDSHSSGESARRPPVPIMGTIIETDPGSGKYVIRSGGRPNHNWTALDEDAEQEAGHMTILVPDFSAAAKAYNVRGKGRQTPFKRDDDIIEFTSYVRKHYKTHGFTTETFLLDPKDDKKVLDAIQFSSQFYIAKAIPQAREFTAKFDEMSQDNSSTSIQHLQNSIEPALLTEINLRVNEEDPISIWWLTLIDILQPKSIMKVETIKTEIRAARSTQFDGENMVDLGEATCQCYFALAS